MKKKILVSDDEVFIADLLKDILCDLYYEVTDTVFNTSSALDSISRNPPDLAILDIKMHGKNQGFEIAKYLQEIEIPFIFLTSFSDKSTVSEAVELFPKAYLVKPFNEQDIFTTLENVFKNLDSKNNFLVIKDGIKHVKVPIDDILFIKVSDKYLEINTENRRFLIRESLSGFNSKYRINDLLQVHRSYMINKNKIDFIKRKKVVLGKHELPVSDKYKIELDKIFLK